MIAISSGDLIRLRTRSKLVRGILFAIINLLHVAKCIFLYHLKSIILYGL